MITYWFVTFEIISGDETIQPIQEWSEKNNVEEYWEAEASDKYFLEQGFTKIS